MGGRVAVASLTVGGAFTRSVRAKRLRVPISLALAVSFGVLVAVAVAAVLLLMADVAERNTRELLVQNAEAVVTTVTDTLDRKVRAAQDQAQFMANLIADGSVAIDQSQRLQDLLLGSLAVEPALSATAVINSDVFGIMAARDATGRPQTVAADEVRNADFRLLLRQGAAAKGPIWSDIGYAATLSSTYAPLIVPVRRDGAFLGVVVVGLSIRDLSKDLAHQYADSVATPFIVRLDGTVVAHPRLADLSRLFSAAEPLLRTDEIGDPALAGFKLDPKGDPDLARDFPQGNIAAEVVSDVDPPAIFLYRQVEGLNHEPWLVGIHYPRYTLSTSLDRISKAILVGVGILVIAVIAAILIGRMIATPMRRLALASERVSRLEFDQAALLPHSLFREIDVAAAAHNAMTTGLRWFETYVPKSLVPILLRRDTPGLEPRTVEVSVLFTDIIGFSGAAERLEAAHLADFLNRHFALLGASIQEHEGTIDKYIGDSIMAFWGAPAAQVDHAERACRAALAMAVRLADFNVHRREQEKPPVRVRIGIHAGSAVASNIGAPGRINYTLVGDTVNIAQRLEQYGKQIDDGVADAIIIASADVVEKLPPDIPRVALGPRVLPGRTHPTEIFRLGSAS